MAGRVWTQEEDQYLRDHYLAETCDEMAKPIGRTKRAVEHRLAAMKLERPEPKKGDVVGNFTLLSDKYLVPWHGQNVGMVKVRCKCGIEKEMKLTAICSGDLQSCGCERRRKCSERLRAANLAGHNRHTTHGLSSHPLYHTYHEMRNRCYLKSNRQHKDYGGRGISVCDEWRESFVAFYDWAITHGWSHGLTLDRKDVNGNYTPDNCRFITMKEQGRNRRNNRQVTAWNETKSLPEWLDDPRCQAGYGTVATRIYDYGWSAEQAISTPPLR